MNAHSNNGKERGRTEIMTQVENYFQVTDPGKEETT